MPASKSAPKTQKSVAPPPQSAANQPLPQAEYPTIEAFVERATSGDVKEAFSEIQEGLGQLKGPRAAQAKKVEVAIERTRELLSYLVEVREKLEADKKGGGKARK
ncbi:MAG: hypothetical protein ACJ790_01125 [Myxococcaceae bacterium]